MAHCSPNTLMFKSQMQQQCEDLLYARFFVPVLEYITLRQGTVGTMCLACAPVVETLLEPIEHGGCHDLYEKLHRVMMVKHRPSKLILSICRLILSF